MMHLSKVTQVGNVCGSVLLTTAVLQQGEQCRLMLMEEGTWDTGSQPGHQKPPRIIHKEMRKQRLIFHMYFYSRIGVCVNGDHRSQVFHGWPSFSKFYFLKMIYLELFLLYKIYITHLVPF